MSPSTVARPFDRARGVWPGDRGKSFQRDRSIVRLRCTIGGPPPNPVAGHLPSWSVVVA